MRGTETEYESPQESPCTIKKAYDNGTVRIKVKNAEVAYNICQLTPYLGTESSGHGGECSISQINQIMTESLSEVPEALSKCESCLIR